MINLKDVSTRREIDSDLRKILYNKFFLYKDDYQIALESELANILSCNVEIKNVWTERSLQKREVFVEIDKRFQLKLDVRLADSFDRAKTVVIIEDIVCVAVYNES